jgi:hypothetical protein
MASGWFVVLSVFIKLSKNIADHFILVLGKVNDIWPVEDMVVVILKGVVLGETPEVAILQFKDVFNLSSSD